jgi:hypothetical protein
MGPAAHITYNAFGPPNDHSILACAKGYEPEVIFYIGANGGPGLPNTETFKKLRDIAPCIQWQSDYEDETWDDLMRLYRREECFDLIVGQTGVKTDIIDMVTLIAVDEKAFHGPMPKTTYCGFAGSARDFKNYQRGVDPWDGRAEILKDMGDDVSYREREPVGDYRGYAQFLKRCLYLINISLTGSMKRYHIKWRVMEAAFADCALLELEGSPIGDWFPKDSFLLYKNGDDARRILKRTKVSEATQIASNFSTYARKHYNPRKIYTEILESLP